MGDYANDVIDAIMDDPTPYYGTRSTYKLAKAPKCKTCGETLLTWVETKDGWQLHERITHYLDHTRYYQLTPHVCKMGFKKYAS